MSPCRSSRQGAKRRFILKGKKFLRIPKYIIWRKKMKRTGLITVTLLSLLLAFGFLSCQQGSGQADVIHIGASICSEGAYAMVGVPYGNIYKAYVDYINQAPEYKDILKGRTIKATIYDDKGDGAAGKTYIEKLINDDKVFSLVGILGT
jgi:ABC-type branched-subunit amino acid transport system substrate-binding protein